MIKGILINQIQAGLFDLDLVIIIMTYLLVMYGETGAGLFAVSQGLLIDIFSGGLLGLFTLLYLVIFVCMSVGSRFFDLYAARGQIIVISAAVFLKGVLLLSFLNIFSLEFRVSSWVFWIFCASALASGLLGPLIFYLMNHLRRPLMGGRGKGSEEQT